MPKPAPPEEILEPDLAICDPHHHLMDFPTQQYMLPDYAADLAEVPGVQSTVFLECSAFYSAHGPEHLRMAGETAFAAGVAAMADSGRYSIDSTTVRGHVSVVGGKGGLLRRLLVDHAAALRAKSTPAATIRDFLSGSS